MSKHHRYQHQPVHAHDAFCAVFGRGRGNRFVECELAAKERRLKAVRERIIAELRAPMNQGRPPAPRSPKSDDAFYRVFGGRRGSSPYGPNDTA